MGDTISRRKLFGYLGAAGIATIGGLGYGISLLDNKKKSQVSGIVPKPKVLDLNNSVELPYEKDQYPKGVLDDFTIDLEGRLRSKGFLGDGEKVSFLLSSNPYNDIVSINEEELWPVASCFKIIPVYAYTIEKFRNGRFENVGCSDNLMIKALGYTSDKRASGKSMFQLIKDSSNSVGAIYNTLNNGIFPDSPQNQSNPKLNEYIEELIMEYIPGTTGRFEYGQDALYYQDDNEYDNTFALRGLQLFSHISQDQSPWTKKLRVGLPTRFSGRISRENFPKGEMIAKTGTTSKTFMEAGVFYNNDSDPLFLGINIYRPDGNGKDYRSWARDMRTFTQLYTKGILEEVKKEGFETNYI